MTLAILIELRDSMQLSQLPHMWMPDRATRILECEPEASSRTENQKSPRGSHALALLALAGCIDECTE